MANLKWDLQWRGRSMVKGAVKYRDPDQKHQKPDPWEK